MNSHVLLRLALGIVMIGFIFGFNGCSQEPEGPAERAGKAVDQATGSAGDSLNKAMENTSETMKDMGEDVKEGAKDAMEGAEEMLEGKKVE